MSLSALVSSLSQLDPEQLHQRNQATRLELIRSEWSMAAHLLATERAGLHRKKGYGDVIAYADKMLDLPRYKACELLRVARAFELMPELSEAFRKGEIGWTKVREITRVATPKTEAVWLERARQHDADTTDSEEEKGLVMAFPPAAVTEAPFPIEDVGGDHRDDSRDDLRCDRLGFQDRQLERVENRRVDEKSGGADDRELDQLMMPLSKRPERPWQPVDRGISKRHKGRVYGKTGLGA